MEEKYFLMRSAKLIVNLIFPLFLCGDLLCGDLLCGDLLCGNLLCGDSLAFAQEKELPQLDSTPPTNLVSTRVEPIRTTPGGYRIATIEPNVPLKVLDDKGSWIKVTFEGWIPRDSVGESKGGAKFQPPALIEIVDFNLVSKGTTDAGGGATITLNIKVKNNAKIDVGSWKGILIVKNKAGQILYSTGITHSDANIAPGKEGETGFYWEEGEKAYEILTGQSKENLDIALYKVTIQ